MKLKMRSLPQSSIDKATLGRSRLVRWNDRRPRGYIICPLPKLSSTDHIISVEYAGEQDPIYTTVFITPSFSSTMHTTILSILAGFILLAIRESCLIVYRLYFHPLAGIPGPRMACASQWYEFYYDILKWPGGQYWSKINEMHERYGEVPPTLSAASPCHIERKYDQSSQYNLPQSFLIRACAY